MYSVFALAAKVTLPCAGNRPHEVTAGGHNAMKACGFPASDASRGFEARPFPHITPRHQLLSTVTTAILPCTLIGHHLYHDYKIKLLSWVYHLSPMTNGVGYQPLLTMEIEIEGSNGWGLRIHA